MNLARTETVNIDLRKLRFDVRQQIQIPLLRQLGMMPALHENLRPAQRNRLLNLPVDLVVRDDVGVRRLSPTARTRRTCSKHCRRWCN